MRQDAYSRGCEVWQATQSSDSGVRSAGISSDITQRKEAEIALTESRQKPQLVLDNIPQLVYNARKMGPREERPKGILGSCDMALRSDTCSAMGASEEDFRFVVEDVLEEVQEIQPGFEDLKAPINKEGAEYFLNQNSREPVTEPDELVPLWKILHLAGVDWTYGSKGWAAENYCLFLADNECWEHVTRVSANQADELGTKVFLNTE